MGIIRRRRRRSPEAPKKPVKADPASAAAAWGDHLMARSDAGDPLGLPAELPKPPDEPNPETDAIIEEPPPPKRKSRGAKPEKPEEGAPVKRRPSLLERRRRRKQPKEAAPKPNRRDRLAEVDAPWDREAAAAAAAAEAEAEKPAPLAPKKTKDGRLVAPVMPGKEKKNKLDNVADHLGEEQAVFQSARAVHRDALPLLKLRIPFTLLLLAFATLSTGPLVYGEWKMRAEMATLKQVLQLQMKRIRTGVPDLSKAIRDKNMGYLLRNVRAVYHTKAIEAVRAAGFQEAGNDSVYLRVDFRMNVLVLGVALEREDTTLYASAASNNRPNGRQPPPAGIWPAIEEYWARVMSAYLSALVLILAMWVWPPVRAHLAERARIEAEAEALRRKQRPMEPEA